MYDKRQNSPPPLLKFTDLTTHPNFVINVVSTGKITVTAEKVLAYGPNMIKILKIIKL